MAIKKYRFVVLTKVSNDYTTMTTTTRFVVSCNNPILYINTDMGFRITDLKDGKYSCYDQRHPESDIKITFWRLKNNVKNN